MYTLSIASTLSIVYTFVMKECAYVLFGATGDLALKKIIPSLMALYRDKKLPPDFLFVAFSRRAWTDADYHSFILPILQSKKFSPEIIFEFLKHTVYVQGVFNEPIGYKKIQEKIVEFFDMTLEEIDVLYHLAVQPEFFEVITHNINNPAGKVLIEKPFGNDTSSAQILENKLEALFAENNIFRIDHYLAKPGLQALINERLTNSSFEERLNNKHVSQIKISLSETIGIEDRGEFYDSVGALRDVGQNHCMAMLATVTMDISQNFQHARAKVLHSLIFDKNSVKLEQYPGYKKEHGVKSDSTTETYFYLEAEIMNSRWENVPVIIEAGKMMKEKKSEIAITFQDGSLKIFNLDTMGDISHDAYEVLIAKAQDGDKNYFAGIEEIIASWRFFDEIIKNKML